jgi:hypothetical protein
MTSAKSQRAAAVWCVQHREGWCACYTNQRPSEGQDNVPTLCAHYVWGPFGFKRRRPTCPACLELLRGAGDEPKGN